MSYPLIEAKNEIITILQDTLKKKGYSNHVQLQRAPEGKGTFAFPCFSLSAKSKKSPEETAKEIEKNLPASKYIEKTKVFSGYLNIYLDKSIIISKTMSSILERQHRYGNLENKNKKVIVEHTSANPNGPLHVGRARNPIIGDTIARLYNASGYQVETQFYVDDLGKQVAILTWGKNHLNIKDLPKPKREKPDHQAVIFYQQAHKQMEKDTTVQQEIGTLVKESELGNQTVIKQIHDAYNPVLTGIKQSLDFINIHIDRYIPESHFVKDKSVEKVIEQLKTSSYCAEEDGAFYLDLKTFGVKGRNTKFFITRKDGTSLYATRDIAYHCWKATQADKLIDILGEDHKLESKQVTIGLKIIGENNLPHPVFYSFVSLPGGKMSTRKGRVVSLDDLIDECIERAYQEVKKRRGFELSEDQMKKIAVLVGIGALRYNIIKVQPEKDIVFQWEEALSFEGNAAPFIQYAHARAAGILLKDTQIELDKSFTDYECLNHSSETRLVMKLAEFPEVIQNASEHFRPHQLCSYLYEVASLFNQFYRDCPVLSENDDIRKQARLHLVYATKTVLHNGLDLIGVNAPEEM